MFFSRSKMHRTWSEERRQLSPLSANGCSIFEGVGCAFIAVETG
jgi:hypothetical protein